MKVKPTKEISFSAHPDGAYIGKTAAKSQTNIDTMTVKASIVPSPSMEYVRSLVSGYEFSATDRIA